MRTKKGFNLRNVCGVNMIIAEGIENIDYSKIISANESSAYLWQNIQGKEFDRQTLTTLLTEQYDVDEATADADAQNLIDQWMKAEIIEK